MVGAAESMRAFARDREPILARLLDLRAGLDPVLARASEADARAQLAQLVDHLAWFLGHGDLEVHAGFLRSFTAKRAADGLGPSSALATLVAIGDIAAQVMLERAAAGQAHSAAEDALAAQVVPAVTHATLVTARMMNALMAEEIALRQAELARLQGGRA